MSAPPFSPLVAPFNKGLAAFSRIKGEAAKLELPTWLSALSARRPSPHLEPVDPITRELPEDSEVMFVYLRPHSDVVVKCDAARLIDYMLSTGDFLDPETRHEFGSDAISQLDVFCTRLGKPLISEARLAAEKRRVDQRFIQDALVGLERLCGEKVAQILDEIEAANEGRTSPEHAQHAILLALPEIRGLFAQIVETDRDFASATCAQFLIFLHGPPNKQAVFFGSFALACTNPTRRAPLQTHQGQDGTARTVHKLGASDV